MLKSGIICDVCKKQLLMRGGYYINRYFGGFGHEGENTFAVMRQEGTARPDLYEHHLCSAACLARFVVAGVAGVEEEVVA